MRNIIDLEVDKLLSKKLNSTLETFLLEGEDLTNTFLALLGFAGNIPAESLNN